jgi:hypothetical protein
MLLDDALSEFDVVERHARVIAAPPARVYAALRASDFSDSPVIRALWRLRSLGTERATSWDAMLRFGFVIVADEPPREIVLGLLAQPWRLRGAVQHPTAAEWRAFDRADFAKIAWSFSTTANDDGGTTLATETRVRVVDPAARRKFRWYWRAIGPFSALIRREMLRLAARRAVG